MRAILAGPALLVPRRAVAARGSGGGPCPAAPVARGCRCRRPAAGRQAGWIRGCSAGPQFLSPWMLLRNGLLVLASALVALPPTAGAPGPCGPTGRRARSGLPCSPASLWSGE
ncbi:MAG: hypothetical protein U5R48_10320 [Gammaproteobacteria bacterium]|nr:hypothetical protein [Gammaproteobacteria bacterium]